MSKFLCIVIFLFLASPCLAADSLTTLEIKNGDIFYDGEQLTDQGRVSEAVVHPDREWIYFVQIPTQERDWEKEHFVKKNNEEETWSYELWRIKASGEKSEMLFKNTSAPMSHPSGYWYATIDNIQFSPSGDRVYFETSEWVTSNALNVMNPDGSNMKQLGAGNNTKIIQSGKMYDDKDVSGYIITNQHRYFLFVGGSYDFYWLYDPEWNEIGPLGDDLKINDFEASGITFTESVREEQG
jgi:hypothetical protein